LSQLVKHIVKAGAKVNVADKNGWRALHYAGYGGSYDVCLVMLSVAALDYRYGLLPPLWFLWFPRRAYCVYMLYWPSHLPLHIAASFLPAASATDNNGRSAADIAKFKGNHAAFKLLGARKAKVRGRRG
jgi:ankyrin repeat protein